MNNATEAAAGDGAGCRKKIRAPGRAREATGFCQALKAAPPAIVIRAVRVPPVERRVLLVMVEVERDGLRMIFSVARRRGGELKVCSPRGPDGLGDGVWLPARERERLNDAILAAVRADPAARATLRIGR
jgi:hypothetical protein